MSSASFPSHHQSISLGALTDTDISQTSDGGVDAFHPRELRIYLPEGTVSYGADTCAYTLGSKPDSIDRLISVTTWSILVLGLCTALSLAAPDPLSLGDNYLDRLYKYLSVIGYFEAAILLILKIAYPAKDAISRVLRFQSRKIPATLVKAAGRSIRLEGQVMRVGLNNARDSAGIEVIAVLSDELDPPPSDMHTFRDAVANLLDRRAHEDEYNETTWESVQTKAIRFIVHASRLSSRDDRSALLNSTLLHGLPSTPVISANDLVLTALARLAVEKHDHALHLLWKWYTATGTPGSSGYDGQKDSTNVVPRGCVLCGVYIVALNDVNAACEAAGLRVIAEFGAWSMRFGFKRYLTRSWAQAWETQGGTLFTSMSVLQILCNEPLYFGLQVLALAAFLAAPWLISLDSGDASYISRAADAAGIGTAVLAAFAYVADTFWPKQRLLWAAFQGLADVRDLGRLARLRSSSKAAAVQQLVTHGGFFAEVGENVGSSAVRCNMTGVNTTLLRVGGVMQEYEEFEVIEENGDAPTELSRKLSPTRMVDVYEFEDGVWTENQVKNHENLLHLYVLGNQLSVDNLLVK